MSKRWKPSVTLIATGIIIPDLHFGPFLRNWWHVRSLQENGMKVEQYYPFRIGMKTQVELKNRPFIIRIVQGNKHNNLLPGFFCESLSESNEEVENDPTSAISNLYKRIFQTETRFSGTLVMGMDDNDILSEIVSDLSFLPFSINMQKINITIHSIGASTNKGIGSGFASSFIYTRSKERALFFQTVNENESSIYIYKENQLSEEFHGSDPNSVWKKMGMLKEWLGETLFGLDNSNVKKKLEQLKKFVCFYNEWHDYSKMEQIFRYHLQKRTCSQVDWYLLFREWKENNCPIIELHSQLASLYPNGYIFSEREMRAWRAMLRATGCINITPFDKEESEYEFWTRSSDPESDKAMINMLYQNGFLRTIPSNMFNATEVFWESFEHSLSLNKRGANGKQRILSIIADKFPYKELQTRLHVSSHTIHNAKIHGRIFGHGCPAAPKPPMRKKIMPQEHEDQFEWFMSRFDLTTGEDIEKALDGLSGTAIAYLKPNCDQRSQSNVKTIPGISNWFEWSWPMEGPLAGYICARDLPNFGEMMTFSVSKFTKTELVQPEPMVGEHSKASLKWTMPIYRASGKLIFSMALMAFQFNRSHLLRWTVDKLKDELNRRNIHFDIGMGRGELVNLLKQEIGEESQIGEESREDFSKTDIDENQIFHLQLGWALKCNQKYGKKGSGKRLVKEVVTALTHFFMVGQRDPSDRYTAKDMLDGLKEMAENGEITTEVIPSLKTIENWITRYSSLSKKEHAERFLEE
ncbi:unnamed protein product [Rhizophagus irregularis]|nr:unnamed protein product [Rhizophagus irregularis]